MAGRQGAVDLNLIKEWCAEMIQRTGTQNSTRKWINVSGQFPQELQEKCAGIPNEFDALKKLFERIIKWKWVVPAILSVSGIIHLEIF